MIIVGCFSFTPFVASANITLHWSGSRYNLQEINVVSLTNITANEGYRLFNILLIYQYFL